MKILVTGGAGFIGSNLVEHLLNQGHSVRVLDDFSAGKRSNLEGLKGEFDVLEGTITSADTCERACQGVHAISHQAAFGSVPRSIESPELYSETNLHGFVNVANAARHQGIQRMVYASSSAVYGDLEASPKVEEVIGKPLSPYAASKHANEIFAHSFASAYGMTFIGLRYFNVFGPKQDPNGPYAAVIPLFLKALLGNQSPGIFDDGEQSRDFTYVQNVVEANTAGLTRVGLTSSKVYNVACGKKTTVNQLFNLIANQLESTLKPKYLPARPGDIRHSLANISKAQSDLGYSYAVGLEPGMKTTVQWFLDNRQILGD